MRAALRSRHHRPALVTVLVVLVGLGAACSRGPTDASYRRDSEAACGRVADRIDALHAPTTMVEVGPYADRVAAEVSTGIDELAAVATPASSREGASSLRMALDAVEADLGALGAAALTGDPDALTSAANGPEADLDALDQEAATLGLAPCTSESWGRVAFIAAADVAAAS